MLTTISQTLHHHTVQWQEDHWLGVKDLAPPLSSCVDSLKSLEFSQLVSSSVKWGTILLQTVKCCTQDGNITHWSRGEAGGKVDGVGSGLKQVGVTERF